MRMQKSSEVGAAERDGLNCVLRLVSNNYFPRTTIVKDSVVIVGMRAEALGQTSAGVETQRLIYELR